MPTIGRRGWLKTMKVRDMTDIKISGAGCINIDDCDGKRGKRGKRGHRGHDGPTGPTGPTGPAGTPATVPPMLFNAAGGVV